jgi:hypothetical protein
MNQLRFPEFLSQSTNEHLNQFGVVFVFMFPNTFAELGACECASRFPHQHLQQRQLARRKLDSFLATVNIVRGQVEREIGDA